MVEVNDATCSPLQIDLVDSCTQTEDEAPKMCIESSCQTPVVNRITTATQMTPPIKETIIEEEPAAQEVNVENLDQAQEEAV